MKSVQEILKLSQSHLEKQGIRNPRRQAEEVISQALKMPRMNLYLEFDRPLQGFELDACRTALQRRAKGEPAQYIAGQVEFFDCILKVSPAALIPRQETEILVDQIANALQKQELEGKVLWDLCCGTGCIGISLNKRFPQLAVSLSDLSGEALSLAKENAQSNGCAVDFLQGDFLEPFQGIKADFLVCNPPYISEKEFHVLEREVKDFEPKMALVGGEDGFYFYRKLANELPAYLNPGATVWLEIGMDQGDEVKKIFDLDAWDHFRIEKDWSGHDRFVSFVLRSNSR